MIKCFTCQRLWLNTVSWSHACTGHRRLQRTHMPPPCTVQPGPVVTRHITAKQAKLLPHRIAQGSQTGGHHGHKGFVKASRAPSGGALSWSGSQAAHGIEEPSWGGMEIALPAARVAAGQVGIAGIWGQKASELTVQGMGGLCCLQAGQGRLMVSALHLKCGAVHQEAMQAHSCKHHQLQTRVCPRLRTPTCCWRGHSPAPGAASAPPGCRQANGAGAG
jgi:hypothetical protein